MADLYFIHRANAEGIDAWGTRGLLYDEGNVNLICATNRMNHDENVVKVTSVDKVTGEKVTQIMPCVMQTDKDFPDSTQSGILMESGKLYFVEIEDLEGNVVFEYTRAYSKSEGYPHKKVHGICDSSKCKVEVPSMNAFNEGLAELDGKYTNKCDWLQSQISTNLGNTLEKFTGVNEELNGINDDIDHLSEEFEYVKTEVYGKFAVLTVSVPSMNNQIYLEYPDDFNIDNTVFLTCTRVVYDNNTKTTTINDIGSMQFVITCDDGGILIQGLPTGTGVVSDKLKFVFMRMGI